MVFRTQRPGGSEVEVKVDISAQVTLEDGAPIVETLQVLKLRVAETLDAFKPEFEGS